MLLKRIVILLSGGVKGPFYYSSLSFIVWPWKRVALLNFLKAFFWSYFSQKDEKWPIWPFLKGEDGVSKADKHYLVALEAVLLPFQDQLNPLGPSMDYSRCHGWPSINYSQHNSMGFSYGSARESSCQDVPAQSPANTFFFGQPFRVSDFDLDKHQQQKGQLSGCHIPVPCSNMMCVSQAVLEIMQ